MPGSAPDAPTVISLFAGAGGSSLGYQMAGYRELLAVECDDNAVATFRLNFPDVPVYHGDIANLSVEECLSLAGLQPGELAVLDGSPPCQGFSTAGKRRMGDERNQLFREYCRLLAGLQPKVFVMENVSGMVKGKMKLIAGDIFRELEACGYRVKAQLMNAMWFDVPQSRTRLLFVGVRSDLGHVPSHPVRLSVLLSVRQALKDVPPDPEAFHVKDTTRLWSEMRAVGPGQEHPRHHSQRRLAWDRPSCTLLAGGGVGHYHHWHPSEHRVLTFNEMKRLASFPDEFRLLGPPDKKMSLIGNSVPPLFMRAIAAHIRTEILDRLP